MRSVLLVLFLLAMGELFTQPTDTVYREINEILAQRDYQTALDMLNADLKSPEHYSNPRHYAELLLYKGKALTHLYRMDEAIEVYDEVTNYGRSIGDVRIEVWGHNSALSLLNFNADYSSLEERCRRVFAIAIEEDVHCVSDAWTLMAEAYTRRNQLDSAMFAFRQAVRIDTETNSVRSVHFNYLGISSIFERMGRTDSALVAITNGYKLLRPGIDDFKLATFESAIANLFLAQRNIGKSKEYALRAIRSGKKSKVLAKLSDAYKVLGEIAINEDSLQLAVQHYETALPYLRDRKIAKRLVRVYASLARVSLLQTEISTAKVYLDSATLWAGTLTEEELKIPLYVAECKFGLSTSDLKMAAASFDDYSRTRIPGISLYSDYDALLMEADLRRAQGNFKLAIDLRKDASKIRDSLFRSEQVTTVNEMEARFNKAESDRRISELDAEKQISAIAIEQKNLQLWGGAIAGLLLMGFGIFLIAQYRKIQRANVKVEVQNDKLAQTLLERELLLKEIHHRVKNNLQVISSLLSLQSREIKDDAALEAVNESRNRVKSMALIHQNLYKEEDLTGIDMRDYVTKLAKSLVTNYKVDTGKLVVSTDIDDLNLDVDTTIPLGLILNELITNVLKYAFPNDREGKLDIKLKGSENCLILEVVDDGIGIGNTESVKTDSAGFGMKMIKTFSKKLDADYEVTILDAQTKIPALFITL